MQSFQYKAKDAKGKIFSGELKARNKSDAKMKIMRMRLAIVSVQAGGKSDDQTSLDDNEKPILGRYIYLDAEKKIQVQLQKDTPTIKDLILFTKQFCTMINSGVSMVQSLFILSKQQRSKEFGKTLKKIQKKIEEGSSLSEAFAAFPDIFDSLYTAMLSAGEASGHLDTILEKLVTYMEKADRIRAKVKKAMTYPIIVLVVACLVITFLLGFVVPIFAAQYSESGRELPGITKMVIDFSDGFLSFLPYIIGGIIGGLSYFKVWIKSTKGRIVFDRFILKTPGFGTLLKKVAVGRFCSTLASMLSAGVNLLEALSICALSSGNKTIEEFILKVRAGVEKGQKFSEPLTEGGFFPDIVVSMVVVGESTGALDDMLKRVSDFFEEEVDLAVEGLLSLIEPVMMIGIGSIVGFIVIAMYLPIFDMASNMGG